MRSYYLLGLLSLALAACSGFKQNAQRMVASAEHIITIHQDITLDISEYQPGSNWVKSFKGKFLQNRYCFIMVTGTSDVPLTLHKGRYHAGLAVENVNPGLSLEKTQFKFELKEESDGTAGYSLTCFVPPLSNRMSANDMRHVQGIVDSRILTIE